ncbi:DNA translocase FtsK [uncultured Clostridium sp.]|jgi:S-DNA-T family DNA segregation ATPase FtsK/SpoIIIE|uniref:DNA translocase FtsK n=1 Tax=uncultured Clostridium sp. TaxID=59620 RepID=UPI00345AE0E4
MATAKRTEKKQTPSAKKNSRKNITTNTKKVSNKKEFKNKGDNEIYGVIAIACSLIFMFSLYTSKLGYLSIISKKIFISLFGLAAFLVPIYCLYISVKYYFLKQKVTISRKYWGIVGGIITTLILLQTLNMTDYYVKNSIMNSFGNFLVSDSYMNGGFIIFIIILPIYKFMGDIGLYIVVIAAYVICSILIFNYNIRGVATGVHKKGKTIQKKATNTLNNQREKISTIRNNRDVNQNTNISRNNFENTLSSTEDSSFREEVEKKMKMIEFMNNSTLGTDELYDDSVIESTENAKNQIINEVVKEKEMIMEEIKGSKYNNDLGIVYGQQEDIRESKKEIPIEKDIEEFKEEIVVTKLADKKYIEIKEQEPIIKKEVEVIKLQIQEKEVVKKIIEDEKIEQGEEEKVKVVKNEYSYPSADLLNINTRSELSVEERRELVESSNKLEEVLLSFGVEAKLLDVTKGPSVTRFEIQPKSGIKVNKIVNLSHDIALGLAAAGDVRIEAPIPGKAAVGIEVPNKKQTPVYFREIIESSEFNDSSSNIACALGKSIEGKPVVADLSAMPHLLIAGATGSGKSVCINTLIVSILYKYSPDEVKLLMVDPKVVELSVYNGIPHLLIPVVTDPKKASGALFWAVKEMDRRYILFAENGARNITSYNNMADKGKVSEKLPYIVIIVDELADLMMVCPGDVEEYICRLAQKARAAGMHLVIATQRPSVDVITGVIKANIPSRISFSVSSQIDSRTILDCGGAEKLLGRGDMLFSPIGKSGNMRVQGAFISEEEVEQVVEHVKGIENTIENNYEAEILKHMESAASGGKSGSSGDEQDELLDQAIKLIVDSGQVSASFIQRRLKMGFNRAARMIEQMEDLGIISEKDGNKPRQVLITKEELENI